MRNLNLHIAALTESSKLKSRSCLYVQALRFTIPGVNISMKDDSVNIMSERVLTSENKSSRSGKDIFSSYQFLTNESRRLCCWVCVSSCAGVCAVRVWADVWAEALLRCELIECQMSLRGSLRWTVHRCSCGLTKIHTFAFYAQTANRVQLKIFTWMHTAVPGCVTTHK